MHPPPRRVDVVPDSAADKSAWRRWARATAQDIDVSAVSARVRAHLGPLIESALASTGWILTYRALPAEIDLDPLLDEFGTARFALTRTPPAGPLTVHAASGRLEPHRYGFDQPAADTATVDPAALVMALVPGLAFDRRGVRLGRGAGHYDRLLSALALDATLVGVTAERLVVDELPVEAHDVLMTHVATEDGVRSCRRGEPR